MEHSELWSRRLLVTVADFDFLICLQALPEQLQGVMGQKLVPISLQILLHLFGCLRVNACYAPFIAFEYGLQHIRCRAIKHRQDILDQLLRVTIKFGQHISVLGTHRIRIENDAVSLCNCNLPLSVVWVGLNFSRWSGVLFLEWNMWVSN